MLDAVRNVIEGQGTLNTTARAGQKATQQVPVLDDFFNALDKPLATAKECWTVTRRVKRTCVMT